MTTTERVQLLSALLGCLALVLAAVSIVATVGAATHRRTSWLAVLHGSVRGAAPVLALSIAATSTAGSLYFSEVADFVPCNLCWYQRIAMYSSAAILLVAVVMRDGAVAPYVLVLGGLGLLTSTYHYIVEWNPRLETDVCSLEVPCTTVWFREFGFMSLPFLAGSGFLAIVSLMLTIVGPASPVSDVVEPGLGTDNEPKGG